MKIVGGKGQGADNEKMRVVEIELNDVVGKQFQVHGGSEGNDLFITYYEDGPSGRKTVLLDDPVETADLPAPFWVKPAPNHRYTGRRTVGGPVVLKDGEFLPIGPSLALCDHSPSGFMWGYGGSGPAQLALALLLDVFGDADLALRLYQDFKWGMVALLGCEWELTEQEIRDWVTQHAKEAKSA